MAHLAHDPEKRVPRESVTQLLHDVQAGDQAALDRLFPLVYDELHRLAQRQRRGWHGDETVNTTALVHEAYLKLVDQANPGWNSRAHFLAVAAKAMRHILINYAKQRRTQKRGGDVHKVPLDTLQPLDEAFALTDERAGDFLALDEALTRLEQINERQSRIVECRFFGGMTIADTATALNVSPATVKRGWMMAQAWLYRELQNEPLG